MINVEKLIEQLEAWNEQHLSVVCGNGHFACDYLCENEDCIVVRAAAALSTLQAENARLREELEYEREHANAYHEECGQWEAENEKLRAEVESLKKGHCAGCSIPAVKAEQIRDLTDAPKLRAELEQVKRKRDAAVDEVERTVERYVPLGPYDRLRELAQADREGKIPKYTIGDTIYDRFGNAWEVTAVERRLLAGEPKWIYRCGHIGTNDYFALWEFEVLTRAEAEAALRREQDG